MRTYKVLKAFAFEGNDLAVDATVELAENKAEHLVADGTLELA